MGNTPELPILSEDVIGELLLLSGSDKSFLIDLYQTFEKSAKDIINQLDSCYANKDTEDLFEHFHKLKGQCLSLGASRLAVQAGNCDSQIKQDKGFPPASVVDEMRQTLELTLKALQEKFN